MTTNRITREIALQLPTIGEYNWTDDYSYHRVLTCVSHPDLRWTTKNYWDRSVFYATPELGRECTCPPEDLRVIPAESRSPYNRCNCESAHCRQHGGMLAIDPDNTTGYPATGRCPNHQGDYEMDYVGRICDRCATTAAPTNRNLIKKVEV